MSRGQNSPQNPANERDTLSRQRLARIRHELRTPVNHIIGYSELLLEEADSSFAGDLQKIRRGGKRLLELLNQYCRDDSAPIKTQDLPQLFHELRTPVNQIIGYSELLQEQAHEADKPELVADLKKIHEAAQLWLAQAEAHLIPDAAAAPGSRRISKSAERSLVAWPFSAPVAPATTVEPGKLLVVDDDESNRELLARRLAHQGHAVTTAETGRQALKLIAKEPFD